MPAPVFSLDTSGANPETTAKEILEAEVNRVVGITFDQANPEDRDAAALSASNAAASVVTAGAFRDQSETFRDQSQVAAIAAGAPIVTSLTSPVPANGTIEIVQTASGGQVWQVVAGAWDFIGWVSQPLFSSIAGMAAATGLINGQSVSVSVGYNGEPEQFTYDATSTLPANGTTVVSTTNIIGRLVSQRKKFISVADMLTDPRDYSTFAAGDKIVARGFFYEVAAEGATDQDLTTAGGVNLYALLEGEKGRSNIIAHRGFRNLNVENTMLAFAEALKWTQHLECDVQYSADNTAYVFHDTTVDALTSGTGTFTALSDATINGLTFDALSGLDLSSLVRIPTFDEFLTYASRRNAFVWPEVKNPRTSADVDTICQDVLDARMQNRCVLQVSFIDYAEQAMDYDREISCGYINANTALAPVQGFVDRLAAYPNRGWLITSYDVITANPSLVEYCRVRHVGLVCWTIPNQAIANQLTALGVENFMTDVPLFVGAQ